MRPLDAALAVGRLTRAGPLDVKITRLGGSEHQSACGDFVDEETVVAHHDHRPRISHRQSFM